MVVSQVFSCCLRIVSSSSTASAGTRFAFRNFVRIRNFGFLANRQHAALLPLCFRALQSLPHPSEPEVQNSHASRTQLFPKCPRCGGAMLILERLTSAQLLRACPNCASVLNLRPLPKGHFASRNHLAGESLRRWLQHCRRQAFPALQQAAPEA